MTATTAMAIKPKNRVERFREYLENNLIADDYNNLHLRLGHVGSHRITRLLNPTKDNLNQFDAEEVVILAKMLKTTPQDLVFGWGIGQDNISLTQANSMVAPEGCTIGVVEHIA